MPQGATSLCATLDWLDGKVSKICLGWCVKGISLLVQELLPAWWSGVLPMLSVQSTASLSWQKLEKLIKKKHLIEKYVFTYKEFVEVFCDWQTNANDKTASVCAILKFLSYCICWLIFNFYL